MRWMLIMALAAAVLLLIHLARSRALHLWLVPYVLDRFRKRRSWPTVSLRGQTRKDEPDGWPECHLFLCLADHFEPRWRGAAFPLQQERVADWVDNYARSVAGVTDSRGRGPCHTFFYPQDEYQPEFLDQLAQLCRAGYGDVEIQLHHDGDTSSSFRDKVTAYRDALYFRHGLLRRSEDGEIRYGFVHGNWALDNSHPGGRHCGVNDEISILVQTGCYADFTMPSAPSETQTRTVNTVYYAVDDPLGAKSHDRGIAAAVGRPPPEGGLLMIQGPLMLDWSRRKWGLLPRIENGELHAGRPPTLDRLQRWIEAGVTVVGRPQWRFVKLHTHGCQEPIRQMLLGPPMRAFHESLARAAADLAGVRYYYVTAWEMACLVRQAELGLDEPAWDDEGRPLGAADALPPVVAAPPRARDVSAGRSGRKSRPKSSRPR